MKFNRKTHEKERLIKLIEKFYEEDNLELEAIIYGIGNQYRLTYHNFVDTYQRLLEDPSMVEIKPSDALNIHFDPNSKYSNIRVTVLGEGSIKNYCSTNSIKDIGYNLKFTQKENYFFGTKMGRVDVNDYHVRFNLKVEKDLDAENKLVKELKENWNDIPKYFRRKKVHSFVTQNGLFNFDLSIVKKSNTITEKMTVSEVMKQRKQHLVIKPKEVKESFYDWWIETKQSPSNKVDVARQPLFYKKIENSNVLTNPENFEIEIELNKVDTELSATTESKSNNKKNDIEKVFIKYVEKVGAVLQAVQGSNYIVGENQKHIIIREYQSLIKNNSYNLFNGPVPSILNMEHIKQYTNREYVNGTVDTIRKDYLVTDKANGERCLLYIAKDRKAYLISRNSKGAQAIKYTGISLVNYGETLLDGEYITLDISGNVVSNYMYFDVYYLRGKDVRGLPLGYHEKQANTRQNLMLQLDNAVKDKGTIIKNDEYNQFTLYRKKYLRGDISNIKNLKMDESSHDTKIFEECNKLLSKMGKKYGGLLNDGHLFSYETDGLMFVPALLGVGQNFKDDDIGILGKKVWDKIYKWQPSMFNSIAFYVKMRRNIIDKQVVDEYYNGIRYKQVYLQITYHPTYHNDYDAQRILNENIIRPVVEHYINFEPSNPFKGYMDANSQLINDAQIASVPTNDEGDLMTIEGEIIQEGNIIEFIYDNNESEERFKWKPLRIKDNNKANGFHTAVNIWKNFNEPITLEMISSGKVESENEFQLTTKGPYDKLTKPLRGFNNFVKIKLLEMITEDASDLALLDLNCGKMVDLKKWKYNNVKFAVAIDSDADAIHNPNDGAGVRILRSAESDADLRKLARNVLLIRGDCSKNLYNGNAGNDLLNKYYLNILYGNHEISGVNQKLEKLWGKGQNRFNIITCNFGIYPFFKDLETLENFMVNVAENLRADGKFVGMCLDGETLFKEMKTEDMLQGFSDVGKHLLWSIEKKYQQTAVYPKNHYSLGYEFTLSIDSVCKHQNGHLVHFDFLVDMMNKYGLKLLDSKMFDENPTSFIESFKNEYPKVYDMLNKNKDLIKLAKYHRWFIFVKTKNKAISMLGKSSFPSGLFEVSASSTKKLDREMSEPDPMSEEISERLLPEDIEYEEEEGEVSEYKSEMSYNYDDNIPSKSQIKKIEKTSTKKKSLHTLLEEKTNKTNKSKKITEMEIHEPNVTMTISKKKKKTKTVAK